MTSLSRLCPKCMTMLPKLFNNISYPCPRMGGQAPCFHGLKLIEADKKEKKTQLMNKNL